MYRNLLFVALVLCAILAVNSQDASTMKPEHAEYEGFNFVYEGSTHLMLMMTGGKCYIWQLTTAEKASVHTDAGIRAIELRLLKQVNGAYYTKVPQVILHPQVISQCTSFGHRPGVEFYLVH